MPGKSPKTIATINFKGGVGKTTVTWCLGDVVSSLSDSRVLMFDLDAQMSLTQAIALNEDTGALEERFGAWYQRSIEKRKTIFDALDAFARLWRRRFRFYLPVIREISFRAFSGRSLLDGARNLRQRQCQRLHT